MAFHTEQKGLDVGIVCQGWVPDVGGVESQTRDLARELIGRGHRVHVLCLDYRPGLEPYSVSEGRVQGVSVRRMAYLYQDQRSLADMVDNWRARDVLFAWLASVPFDVIHVHHLTGWGTGALKAVDEVGLPLVMTLHDYWPLCPRGQMMRSDGTVCAVPEPETCGACLLGTWPHLVPGGGGEGRRPGGGLLETDAEAAAARTAYALECLALPQRLLTPSRATRDVYVRAGVAEQRIEVCENGIAVETLARDVARLKGELTRPAEAKDEIRLGVLGSALPSKGTLELARAFVAADVPNLTLEVHGNRPSYHGDSSYADALEELAASDPRIRLHGPFEMGGLARVLAGLDGVAAPSIWTEVFGLTVREASAAGLPVLVSDAGDLAAVAQEGAKGLVVAAGDEAAWVQALRTFGTDAEARKRWADAPARLRSAEEMALQVERAYAEVIREVTKLEPLLVHPVKPPPEESAPGGGFLKRLFGRG